MWLADTFNNTKLLIDEISTKQYFHPLILEDNYVRLRI